MIDPAVSIEDVDPEAFAHLNEVLSRRSASGATVVVVDPAGLDDLSAQLVELATSTDDQGVLLTRCRQAYLDHPAVAVQPAPSPEASTADGWAAVQALLDGVPDGHWVEVAAGPWLLAAQVRGGRVVRITSDPPEGAVRAVRAVGEVSAFDAVLSAADSLGELRARVAAGSVRIEMEKETAWPG